MKRHLVLVAGPVVAATALTWSTASRAQGTTVVQAPPQTVVAQPAPVAEQAGYSGPNRALIATGLVTFGLSYIPGVIVAGESSQPADHHLYVPVAGPWLDLANRPACGPNNVGCDTENTNKVLLVVDGVFQGLGVLSVVAGFLSPEHEVVTAAEAQKPTLHFTPAEMGAGGVGAAAFGTF